MSLPEGFVFSQSALQDYVDCSRRFELRYLLGVRWPAPHAEPALEYEELTRKGAQFHQMIEQHGIGIPAEIISANIDDAALRGWWQSYLLADWSDLPQQRFHEFTLTTPLANHLLTAKFDLVAVEPGKRLVIVDWKTGRPPRRETLRARMQTLVYPYVLVKAGSWLNGGEIAPDQVEIRYWYAADGGHTIAFKYSAAQFREDEERLSTLINEIAARATFPLTDDERHCRFCTYRSLCERGIRAGDLTTYSEAGEAAALIDSVSDNDLPFDFDDIEEIAF